MNPCRCGFLGDATKECKRAPICGEEYKNKISGPLLDRIDIVVEVGQFDFFTVQKNNFKNESSEIIKQRVTEVRNLQKQRFAEFEELKNMQMLNSKMSGKFLDKFCKIDEDLQNILQNFVTKSKTSIRGITRILRVARTIADMENSEEISRGHLLEAISFRKKL
jgi:magnesium chelatase family protein